MDYKNIWEKLASTNISRGLNFANLPNSQFSNNFRVPSRDFFRDFEI